MIRYNSSHSKILNLIHWNYRKVFYKNFREQLKNYVEKNNVELKIPTKIEINDVIN